jgi:hypothetical protein
MTNEPQAPGSHVFSATFVTDIPCITHVLNLVIQDILKALIKNNYDISYTIDIYKQEK